MPGLINSAMQPQQPRGGQQIVERIVMAATHALNQAQIEQSVIQMVKSSPDAQGLARATMMLMQLLVEKSQGLPPQAFLPAAGQVLGAIAKMCAAAKVLQPSPQLVDQALQALLQLVKQRAAAEQQPAQPAQPAPAAQPGIPPAAPMPQGA